MRKLPFVTLTTMILISLVACTSTRKPNSTNFANTINQYFEKHGEICTTIGQPFPIDVPASTPQSQYALGPQLAALRQAGIVSETDTTAVVHGMLDTLHGPTPPQRVRRYQLTSEGQKYVQQVPATFGQTGGLCYGQRIVDSVIKWSAPPTVNGISETEVTYTYKITNLAPWAERPEIKQAFPDIKAFVDGESATNQTIGLRLESSGWEVLGQ